MPILLSLLITPYKSLATNLPENRVFSKFLAKSRVRNEHTIGILKARWTSLNELRIAINKREDAEYAVGWIITCCSLHNMLAKLGDEWEETARSTVNVDSSQNSHLANPISPLELRITGLR